MVSADGRYVAVFNGEIYNHQDLRRELEADGIRFRGHSDTEVMLALAGKLGAEALPTALWGMFAIVLWDRSERVLWLMRDRLGEKPLYYGRSNGVFLFGSELKALRAHPRFDGRISRRALASFLRLGYVPGPHCIFEDFQKLLPGCFVRVRDGREPEMVPYWSLRDIVGVGARDRSTVDDDEALQELDELLRDATCRRMIADVPIGAFLSGGVDSSTVVSLMQGHSGTPSRTFTIGFEDAAYNEAVDAKAVSRHLGTQHTELYATAADALQIIPTLHEVYDEPFADSSQIPSLLVSRLARRDVTVVLSGDGGDEVFGGYTRYLWAPGVTRSAQKLPRWLRRLCRSGLAAVSPEHWDGLTHVLPPHLRQRALGDKVHKLGLALAGDTPDDFYRLLVSCWPEPPIDAAEIPSILHEDLRAELPDFVERMMLLDTLTYLPDDILVKVDRASMAVGLEVRTPLLDHRVVEWAWRQPLSRRLRHGDTKWALRRLLGRYAPPALIERPKAGFALPLHDWLRGPLRDWAEALLSPARLRESLLDPGPIRRAWAEHIARRANRHQMLWPVLMWQAWHDAGWHGRWHPDDAAPGRDESKSSVKVA